MTNEGRELYAEHSIPSHIIIPIKPSYSWHTKVLLRSKVNCSECVTLTSLCVDDPFALNKIHPSYITFYRKRNPCWFYVI